jgi:hypothetical protein
MTWQAVSDRPLQQVVEAGLIAGRWVTLTGLEGKVVGEVCLRLKYTEGLVVGVRQKLLATSVNTRQPLPIELNATPPAG